MKPVGEIKDMRMTEVAPGSVAQPDVADEPDDEGESHSPLHATIKDEDIERARMLVGVDVASSERQYLTAATEDAIRNFAVGYGDDNPLFTDPEYGRTTRWGGQLAPSIMAAVINKPMLGDALGADLKKVKKGLFSGIHVFVSGSEWDWYQPIRPGDALYSFGGEDGVEVKPSEFSGRTVTRFLRTVKVNQRGEVVAVYRKRSILSERGEARRKGKYTAIEPARYSDADIARIDEIYAAEKPRGAQPRYWEDVEIGQDMGRMAKGPLTVTDIIVFHAGGYGFFPYAPTTGRLAYRNRLRIPAFYLKNEQGVPDVAQRVHWDSELSLQTTGNPLPYDYGVMRETWVYHFLSDWAGDDAWICRMYDEVRKFNYMGDTQIFTGKVVDKRPQSGCCLCDVEIESRSQRDVVCTVARATLALPSRRHGSVLLPQAPEALRRRGSELFARHCELLGGR